MIQLWLFDCMQTAQNDATKITFPKKDFAWSLVYKTKTYSPTWTGGRMDESEAQQTLRDLAGYASSFTKTYRYICWFLYLLYIASWVVWIIVFINLEEAEDSDLSDTDAFEDDLNDMDNLWDALGIFTIVWFILYIVLICVRGTITTEKLRERAAQINVSFAARGLRWEIPKACCNCGDIGKIEVWKDYKKKKSAPPAKPPVNPPAYLPPQDPNNMMYGNEYYPQGVKTEVFRDNIVKIHVE